MEIRIIFLSGLIAGTFLFKGYGQPDSATVELPPGQAFGKIFTNFHAGLTEADRSSAFEVRRAYFGYNKQLNNYFSAEVKLDIGSHEDLPDNSGIRRYAYFKTAGFFYRTDRAFFKFGIFDIDLFKIQEDYWGHRYILRSMMDIHEFGDKADLGASFHYMILDFLSADITVMNGEGYRNLQMDNAFKTGIGLSVYPQKNLLIRFFTDYTEKQEKQLTLASFLAYRTKQFTLGFEYNYKINKDFMLNYDQTGLSGYISYQLNDKIELFGRYDKLASNSLQEGDDPWNIVSDGSAFITGFQY